MIYFGKDKFALKVLKSIFALIKIFLILDFVREKYIKNIILNYTNGNFQNKNKKDTRFKSIYERLYERIYKRQ